MSRTRMLTEEERTEHRKINQHKYRQSPKGKLYKTNYRKRHPQKYRKQEHYQQDIHRLYGLTKEEYDILLISQSGRCAICGEAKPLVIDHDHETGKVRGLLCRNCNIAVGLILNKPNVASSMAEYLK